MYPFNTAAGTAEVCSSGSGGSSSRQRPRLHLGTLSGEPAAGVMLGTAALLLLSSP